LFLEEKRSSSTPPALALLARAYKKNSHMSVTYDGDTIVTRKMQLRYTSPAAAHALDPKRRRRTPTSV
jgi:hypothetical protein